MTIIRNAIPSSVRTPIESSRFAQGVMLRAQKSPLVSSPQGRALSLANSRFARLPQEPEDARITGVTRSLTRRLLALNVSGSLRIDTAEMLAVAKIA